MSATPKVNDNLSYQENMLGSSTLCKLTLTFTCPLWLDSGKRTTTIKTTFLRSVLIPSDFRVRESTSTDIGQYSSEMSSVFLTKRKL